MHVLWHACIPTSSAEMPVLGFELMFCCNTGKAIAPVYEQLSKQHPDVSFYKLDIDNKDVEKVVVEHGITGVVSGLLNNVISKPYK